MPNTRWTYMLMDLYSSYQRSSVSVPDKVWRHRTGRRPAMERPDAGYVYSSRKAAWFVVLIVVM